MAAAPGAPPAPAPAAGSCGDAIAWFHRTGTMNAWPCSQGGPGVNAHWNQQNCDQAGNPGAGHGLHHTVCGACYDQGCIQVGTFNRTVSFSPRGTPNGGAYVRRGITIIPASNAPWPSVQPPGLPRFDEFWTRLCSACERIEQERIDLNIAFFNAGGAVNARQRAMWNWPWNECECLKLVGWQGPNVNPPAPPAGQSPTNAVNGDPKARLCI